MEQVKSLKSKIRDLKPVLTERFGVSEIGIFGSFLRGAEKPDSDLDILVDFGKPIGLFHFIRLENFLSNELGVKVDLVMKDSLKPRIRAPILETAEFV